MLSSPVYTEAHPRCDALTAASSIAPVFSNFFRSNSFRTLAPHFQTSASSNLFEIKRFRTLCHIPGIAYPLSISDSSAEHALDKRKIDARFAHFFATTPFLATLAFSVGGGGGETLPNHSPQRKRLPTTSGASLQNR